MMRRGGFILGATVALLLQRAWAGNPPAIPAGLYLDRCSEVVYQVGTLPDGSPAISRASGEPNTSDVIFPAPNGGILVGTLVPRYSEEERKSWGMEDGGPWWFLRELHGVAPGVWAATCPLTVINPMDKSNAPPQSASDPWLVPLSDPREPLAAAWLAVPEEEFCQVLKLEQAGDISRARKLAKVLLGRHPDSAVCQLAALDLAVLAGDGPAVRELLQQCRGSLDASPDVLLATAPEYYDDWLVAWQASRDGTNVDEKMLRLFGRERLRSRVPWNEAGSMRVPLPRLVGGGPMERDSRVSRTAFLELVDSLRPGEIDVRLDRPLLLHSETRRVILDLQVFAKTAAVRADFALLSGNPDQALREIGGIHRFATIDMGTSPDIIADLVGIAVAALVRWPMQRLCLDGSPDPAVRLAYWNRLDAMYHETVAAAREPKAWNRRVGEVAGDYWKWYGRTNGVEASIRNRVCATKYALLHSAMAADQHLARAGGYPEIPKDFGPLLPGGPDPDPFGEGPLRFVPESARGWVIYSLGPDREDQHAEYEYDPTNGTISGGDLSITLRREREYPFPAAGKAPATRQGIMDRYRQGLPADPFNHLRGTSYVVSDTTPAVIWSYGPDMDSEVPTQSPLPPSSEPYAGFGACRRPDGLYLSVDNMPSQPEYDPTNGVISAGNLYLNTGTKPARARGAR